jgi:hypothetical protein
LKQLVFDMMQFVWIHATIKYQFAGDHELPEFVAQRHEVAALSEIVTVGK